MKTLCCAYEYGKLPHPVYFNPYNQVVQCHNCGEVYVPQLDVSTEEEAIAKRVNTECRKMIYLKWTRDYRPIQRCDKPKGHEGGCSFKGHSGDDLARP
jgi:hypothetical protein